MDISQPFSTQGGHASSFDGEGGQDVGIPQSYLLQVVNHAKRLLLGMVISIMNHLTCMRDHDHNQVRGTSQLTCKAIQETLSASSLNTNDCFVLVNPDQVVMIMILMIRE